MTADLKSRAGASLLFALAVLLAVFAIGTSTPPLSAQSGGPGLATLELRNGNNSVYFVEGVFQAKATAYSARVADNVREITVDAAPADTADTVTVNGTATDADDEADVNLTPGDNTIIVVVSGSTSSHAYVLTVHRNLVDDAGLKSLKVMAAGDKAVALSPEFTASTLAYQAEVRNSIETVSVTAMVSDQAGTATDMEADGDRTEQPGAKVAGTIQNANNTTATAISDLETVSLDVGANVVRVTVTAENATTTKTYTIHLTRQTPSTNADLASLSIVHGEDDENITLSPAFVGSRTVYTAEIPLSVSAVTVIAMAADSLVTEVAMTVDGGAVSGSDLDETGPGFKQLIDPVADGQNVIAVTITPEAGRGTDDAHIKTYTIYLTRLSSATNADLESLAVMAGDEAVVLAPEFRTDRSVYVAEVNNSVKVVTVTAAASDENVTSITVTATPDSGDNAVTVGADSDDSNGVAVVSVSSLTDQETNVITVAVLPQDTTVNTAKRYVIYLTRMDPGTNADLESLRVMAGDEEVALTPAFDMDANHYAGHVGYSTMAVTVNAVASDSSATVAGDGEHSLNLGINNIIVSVTAGDGSTNNYVITITRAQPGMDAALEALVIMAGGTMAALDPAFAADAVTYSAATSHSSVNVTATAADANATVSGDGEHSLNLGVNIIPVTVTAEDGSTTRNYTIVVIREQEAAGSNASLRSLLLSDGALTPAFAAETTEYTATVGNSVVSVNVTATAADANATVTGDGSHALTVGVNTITVTVTAEDGSTMDYTLTLLREAERGVVAIYDADTDGEISIDELFNAIDDYFADLLSIDKMFEVIDAYFLSD